MTAAPGQRWKVIAVAALSATLVAGLGGAATQLGPWYYGLRKPLWQPPDWLFGPAWTVIFALIAAAGVAGWRAAADRASQVRLIALFGVNGFLNVLWSVLFFHLQRPDWALVEVVLLWLSILVLIIALAPLSRLASWLLVPYLAWVSFASVLNLAIVRLNQPFSWSMSELFDSGRIVDLIVALLIVEAALLLGWRRITGRGPAATDLLANLLAGLFLLLALRAALVHAGWGWIAVCLGAALVAHVADVARRWRS